MNTPTGYRLAHSAQECASPHALVFDTDLRYWRRPTAWEIQSPTAIIAVPHTEQSSAALRGCLGIVTALAIAFGVGLILYIALHI
jgi:hypothetical protein